MNGASDRPVLLALLVLTTGLVACGDDDSVAPGPLRLRADAYDAWHLANHQPHYGATVEVFFADESLAEPTRHGGAGDSTIWTGTYLGSQALRYAVTGEEQARQNVLRMADTLHHHLRATGKPGFIGRYRAPVGAVGVLPCGETDENCHVVESGEYAGDLWKGNTSRDQYTGWFFGMALAYEHVDDEAMRATIREDVIEVIDRVAADNYLIVDVDGIATTAGPEVLSPFAYTWHLIAYLVAGRDQDLEAAKQVAANRGFFELTSLAYFNRYSEYYGNNLAHTNSYSAARLSRRFELPEIDFFVQVFENQIHPYVHLTHNAWFETIHQVVVDERIPEIEASIREDLAAFRDAPNRHEAVFPPDAPVDPASVFLELLQDNVDFLEDLTGNIDPQAQEAYPVPFQCSTDFLWQRNPFRFECGAGNLAHVDPGVDYLAAYWMARYHGFLEAGE